MMIHYRILCCLSNLMHTTVWEWVGANSWCKVLCWSYRSSQIVRTVHSKRESRVGTRTGVEAIPDDNIRKEKLSQRFGSPAGEVVGLQGEKPDCCGFVAGEVSDNP